MKQHMLLILLFPMTLLGMNDPVDPRTIHSPEEDPMWWQATCLAGKKVTSDYKTIGSVFGAIPQVACSSWAFIVAHTAATSSTAATAATVVAAPTWATGVISASGVSAAGLTLPAGSLTIVAAGTATTATVGSTGVISASGVSAAGLTLPAGSLVTAVAVPAAAVISAVLFAEQTREWGFDVYDAYQNKKAFLAKKEQDIRDYDAFIAKKDAQAKTFLGKTKNLFRR